MKFKRLTAAVVLLSLSVIPAVSASNFTDTNGHWARDIIDTLAAEGVVSGVSDTEFNPDGTVTRAEFLRMALGAAGIDETAYRSGECLDVNANDWFAPCVQSALDKGLIPEAMIRDYSADIIGEGNSSKAVYSGYFDANMPIKREEMAYITESVFQYSIDSSGTDMVSSPKDMYFTDLSSISLWALDGVRHAYSNGIISGMDDDSFRPQATATRAQSAAIIYQLLGKLK